METNTAFGRLGLEIGSQIANLKTVMFHNSADDL
jgi:hypothetical protein